MSRAVRIGASLLVASLTAAPWARAQDAGAQSFTYAPPGELVPTSGKGRADTKNYSPGMRFPVEAAPAFANSQVWGRGGSSGGGGNQCDKENFSYPWHDNYCESRTWDMPLCPSGQGHQGQDIRAASCRKGIHGVVSTVDGTITNIGKFSVYVTDKDGNRYDFLHMSNVAVKLGQAVKRGDRLGMVSNEFNGTPTSVHLHFNMRQPVAGIGMVYVPTYMALVDSYKELLNGAPSPLPPPPVVDAGEEMETEVPFGPDEQEDPGPDPDSGCSLSTNVPAGSTPFFVSFGIMLGAVLMVVRRWTRSKRR